MSQGFHRAPQGHGRLGPSAALGEGVRELREGSPAGKAATPPSSLREPRTPYPLPRSASGEGRTRSYPADAPGDPRPGIGRGPGLPSPSRHACGRTDGGEASKSMAAFISYSQHRKWKFPGPGPSREVTDRCSRELFARRRRGSYSPGEGPVAALRPALALPAAPAPLPALHPSHPRGLCVEFAGLVGGDSGGPGSSRLYISPFPTPSLVLGRETPGAWVSCSLDPQEPSGKARGSCGTGASLQMEPSLGAWLARAEAKRSWDPATATAPKRYPPTPQSTGQGFSPAWAGTWGQTCPSVRALQREFDVLHE